MMIPMINHESFYTICYKYTVAQSLVPESSCLPLAAPRCTRCATSRRSSRAARGRKGRPWGNPRPQNGAVTIWL